MPFSFDDLVGRILQASRTDRPEEAIRRLLKEVVAQPDDILAQTPADGEDEIHLYEDENISIWRCRFQPHVVMPPHEHKLKVLIAGYAGAEKSVLYERSPGGLRRTGTATARCGDVITLDADAIHTVIADGDTPSLAIHVYLGPLTQLSRDLFDPDSGQAIEFTMENFNAMTRPATD